jgi:predicted site-specific integrase-resolvase
MHDREWFTRTEASQYAGVSIATIDRWVQDGLPSS